MTYYYRQKDRRTGEMLGIVTYDDVRPNNDHPDIELEETDIEEYLALFDSVSPAEESQ